MTRKAAARSAMDGREESLDEFIRRTVQQVLGRKRTETPEAARSERTGAPGRGPRGNVHRARRGSNQITGRNRIEERNRKEKDSERDSLTAGWPAEPPLEAA